MKITKRGLFYGALFLNIACFITVALQAYEYTVKLMPVLFYTVPALWIVELITFTINKKESTLQRWLFILFTIANIYFWTGVIFSMFGDSYSNLHHQHLSQP